SGSSGITDCTPPALSFSTASCASVLVVAVWSGLAATVWTIGVMPAFFRSGRRERFSASWSAAWSDTTTPTFLPWPRRPELSPHCTTASSTGVMSGPVHQRYGEPRLVQLVVVDQALRSGV